MKITNKFKLGLAVVLTLGFCSAIAQEAPEAPDDHADVWATIEEEWNADEKGDRTWPERLLADDFAGWNKDSPSPRDKSSTRMWDRFNEKMGAVLAHELYLLSIIVHDDVAVAHYLYSSAYRPKNGEIEMRNGRYTDVLVRTEDGWKFIAWHGGDD